MKNIIRFLRLATLVAHNKPLPFCKIFWVVCLHSWTSWFVENKPYKDMNNSTFLSILNVNRSEFMKKIDDDRSSIPLQKMAFFMME